MMNRKEFIRTCGISCLALAGIKILSSCSPAKQVQAVVNNNMIQFDKKEFEISKDGKIRYRKSISTKPANLDFPIVVYRFSDNSYSALLLRCTHQSNELNLNGDIMTCSAHGSEFNNKGEVIQGPAEQNLEAFRVTSDEKNIYIHLS